MLKEKTIYPLDESPLRYPGQSLDERITEIFEDEISSHLLIISVAFALVVSEWIHWWLGTPPQPLILTVVMSLVILYFILKIKKLFPTIKNMMLGRDGERTVGLDLEHLDISKLEVFHDLINEKGNIDHILVSPNGIFTVETKIWRKHSADESRIGYDGKYFHINGYRYGDELLLQSRAEASYLHDLLGSETKKYFWVQPVLLFPGYSIDPSAVEAALKNGVWLFNPEMLEAEVLKQSISLTQEECFSVNRCIGQFIRKTNN